MGSLQAKQWCWLLVAGSVPYPGEAKASFSLVLGSGGGLLPPIEPTRVGGFSAACSLFSPRTPQDSEESSRAEVVGVMAEAGASYFVRSTFTPTHKRGVTELRRRRRQDSHSVPRPLSSILHPHVPRHIGMIPPVSLSSSSPVALPGLELRQGSCRRKVTCAPMARDTWSGRSCRPF